MSKHRPTNREEFKELCLRNLGHPVIQINVSDDQVEDCIEEALKYFHDYHFDGSEHVYYTHILTAEDIANRSFEIPENIIGVTEVYSPHTQSFTNLIASVPGGYQMMLETAFTSSNGGLVNFYSNMVYYNLLQQVIEGMTPIRFNRHTNRIHIDKHMERYQPGQPIVVDAYAKVETPDIWSDRWLTRYTTAKIKQRWGQNLSKYEGMMLPGNITFSGAKYYDDATTEIQMLEDQMMNDYSVPPLDQIG